MQRAEGRGRGERRRATANPYAPRPLTRAAQQGPGIGLRWHGPWTRESSWPFGQESSPADLGWATARRCAGTDRLPDPQAQAPSGGTGPFESRSERPDRGDRYRHFLRPGQHQGISHRGPRAFGCGQIPRTAPPGPLQNGRHVVEEPMRGDWQLRDSTARQFRGRQGYAGACTAQGHSSSH